jgi:phage terminase large subunit-like protein
MEQSQPLNMHSLVSSLSGKEQLQQLLSTLSPQQKEALAKTWSFLRRTDQFPDPFIPNTEIPWSFWLYLAGRGAGKTRSGAEWIRDCVKQGAKYIALIAPTTADARKVMVEGPSGILATSWRYDVDCHGNPLGVPEYSPTNRQVTWANGATAVTYSSEEPDRLRGPQHEKIWADELAAWKNAQETWDMAMMGLRIGANPQAMVSTTPRPIPALRELIRNPSTVMTYATTYDNAGNLAPTFINTIIRKYEGTRLGQQELLGKLIEEAEGALWSRQMMDEALLKGPVPEFKRVVVAVDPAITVNPTSNLTGIVAAGLTHSNTGVVLDDASGRYSPNEWATKALALLDHHGADCIVAEGNQGGDMVRAVIQGIRPNAPIRIVYASRSKQARAEPVSLLYEQHRVFHVRAFPELEDQCCTWEPLSGDPSPDRLDALVWALTALMVGTIRKPSLVIPIIVTQQRSVPGATITPTK